MDNSWSRVLWTSLSFLWSSRLWSYRFPVSRAAPSNLDLSPPGQCFPTAFPGHQHRELCMVISPTAHTCQLAVLYPFHHRFLSPARSSSSKVVRKMGLDFHFRDKLQELSFVFFFLIVLLLLLFCCCCCCCCCCFLLWCRY